MPSAPDELARLLTTIARFNRWATRNAEFAHDAVTGRSLSLVDELQPVRISALAAADHTTQPTMTAHVRRLESAGLLDRARDPSDARAALLTLSPAGRSALAEFRAARAAALLPLVGALDDSDRRVLADAVAVLDRLLATADATAASSAVPPRRTGSRRRSWPAPRRSW